ncbi:MAG: hypothetical protein AB8G05_09115 [Oligoflexales bacterium]
MKLIISILCLSLIACGSPSTETTDKTSNQNQVTPKTQTEDEKSKPNSSSISIDHDGFYIHKEHKLASPIYEFFDGDYRSIEIVGSNQDCILAETIEGEFHLLNSSTVIL